MQRRSPPCDAPKDSLTICKIRVENIVRVCIANGHRGVGQVAQCQHLLCEERRDDQRCFVAIPLRVRFSNVWLSWDLWDLWMQSKPQLATKMSKKGKTTLCARMWSDAKKIKVTEKTTKNQARKKRDDKFAHHDNNIHIELFKPCFFHVFHVQT